MGVTVDAGDTRKVPVFCPLCVSRCGATATIEDGRFVALGPDPQHPTGQAVCVKGKAAPELVAHPDRLEHPLRRTNPKGAADPGWERISWDEALDTIATRLRAIADEDGPESVVFSSSSPSTTAISDAIDWYTRLRRAFGSPNQLTYMELCGWGRYFAPIPTFGAPVPGAFMPDLEQAGCILFWGYNPSVSRLVHATQTASALRRGAKLVVVDPRRAGLAAKADHWLRVRPGTDAAIALALTAVMIENGWYDDEFVRSWTDAPLLVRSDTGRFLRGADLEQDADPTAHVAWDGEHARPALLDPSTGSYDVDPGTLTLHGDRTLATTTGEVACRTVFDLVAERCRDLGDIEALTGVDREQIEATARTLWESRPVAFYTWSGLEQHSNVTQTMRAICQLYALTGSFDAPGGNVLFSSVPTAAIDGPELLSAQQRAKAIGLADRPVGPARYEFPTGEDVWTACLDARPYRVRGMVNLGANLTMAHGDSARVRDALASLDFFVHADLFLNPTAELADIVLPVASAFETEALRVGFEVSAAAQSRVQVRTPVAPRRGEAKSDLEIIFALASRLGLGEHFWDGDVDAAWRHQLSPSGVTLEQLRAEPRGLDAAPPTSYRKHTTMVDGVPAGFRTPTRKVQLYSEELLDHGHPPLPTYAEPSISPRSRPDLADRFPLVLTCAKSLHFCETQHRNIAKLRARAPDPEVEIHPDAAAARGIGKGDWVRIETPFGDVRARARFDRSLDAGVVCAQHGWWQGCDDLDLAGAPPYGPDSTNLNLVLQQGPSDPISGSSPLRASVCEVVRDATHAAAPVDITSG